MTAAEWDETLDANLKSAFLCTHFALPHMTGQRYGRIVSIASGLGVRGAARSSAYAASKAGLMAFSASVSLEVFDHGVTVNCIAPGLTDTPLMRNANTPEEIAATIAGETRRRRGAVPVPGQRRRRGRERRDAVDEEPVTAPALTLDPRTARRES